MPYYPASSDQQAVQIEPTLTKLHQQLPLLQRELGAYQIIQKGIFALAYITAIVSHKLLAGNQLKN
jgi:hypothetical protein